MLTVKHVVHGAGVVLFPAARVEFRAGIDGQPDRVIAYPGASRDEDRASECQNGVVYVMNDAGATVDHFYLGEAKSAGPVVTGYGELKAGTGTATSLPAA